jgi:hypothetical protein
MKSIDIDRVVIQGEQGATLEMFRDNMGEPYRSGVSIWIEKPGDGRDRHSGLFLEERDVDAVISGLQALRKKL